MEFQEVVTTRRSVRKYTDKEIAEEDLREIVRLASYAPSWKNTQC
ncbi:MAG: nitroreductase family protein, partial [Lachnospiraceae bacterium]|nr:nitroreductase family protein [Lachnospiraceae bacterium]